MLKKNWQKIKMKYENSKSIKSSKITTISYALLPLWIILSMGCSSFSTLSTGASMRVEVEVYKGPLSRNPDIQWGELKGLLREVTFGLRNVNDGVLVAAAHEGYLPGQADLCHRGQVLNIESDLDLKGFKSSPIRQRPCHESLTHYPLENGEDKTRVIDGLKFKTSDSPLSEAWCAHTEMGLTGDEYSGCLVMAQIFREGTYLIDRAMAIKMAMENLKGEDLSTKIQDALAGKTENDEKAKWEAISKNLKQLDKEQAVLADVLENIIQTQDKENLITVSELLYNHQQVNKLIEWGKIAQNNPHGLKEINDSVENLLKLYTAPAQNIESNPPEEKERVWLRKSFLKDLQKHSGEWEKNNANIYQGIADIEKHLNTAVANSASLSAQKSLRVRLETIKTQAQDVKVGSSQDQTNLLSKIDLLVGQSPHLQDSSGLPPEATITTINNHLLSADSLSNTLKISRNKKLEKAKALKTLVESQDSDAQKLKEQKHLQHIVKSAGSLGKKIQEKHQDAVSKIDNFKKLLTKVKSRAGLFTFTEKNRLFEIKRLLDEITDSLTNLSPVTFPDPTKISGLRTDLETIRAISENLTVGNLPTLQAEFATILGEVKKAEGFLFTYHALASSREEEEITLHLTAILDEANGLTKDNNVTSVITQLKKAQAMAIEGFTVKKPSVPKDFPGTLKELREILTPLSDTAKPLGTLPPNDFLAALKKKIQILYKDSWDITSSMYPKTSIIAALKANMASATRHFQELTKSRVQNLQQALTEIDEKKSELTINGTTIDQHADQIVEKMDMVSNILKDFQNETAIEAAISNIKKLAQDIKNTTGPEKGHTILNTKMERRIILQKLSEFAAQLKAKAMFSAQSQITAGAPRATRMVIANFGNFVSEYSNQISSRTDSLLKQLEGIDRHELPLSAYLRDSKPTDFLNLYTWNRAGAFPIFEEILKNPFHALSSDETTDRVRVVERLFADYNWSNINTAYASGQGEVSMAFVKDDIGNWSLKTFSSDPTEVVQAYAQLTGKAIQKAIDLAGEAAAPGSGEAKKQALNLVSKLASGKTGSNQSSFPSVNLSKRNRKTLNQLEALEKASLEKEIKFDKDIDAKEKDIPALEAAATSASEQAQTTPSTENEEAQKKATAELEAAKTKLQTLEKEKVDHRQNTFTQAQIILQSHAAVLDAYQEAVLDEGSQQ